MNLFFLQRCKTRRFPGLYHIVKGLKGYVGSTVRGFEALRLALAACYFAR